MHTPSPPTAATVPGLHSLGATLPVLQLWPTVQLVHCEASERLVASLKVPAGQGSAALAPLGQKEPWSQASQLVSPPADWKLPAAHGTHTSSPSTAAIVPGLHWLGVTLPVLQLWPTVQSVHCEALTRLVAVVKVPAGHGSAAAARSSQK